MCKNVCQTAKIPLHFAINKKHFQACRFSLHAGNPKIIDHEQNPALSRNKVRTQLKYLSQTTLKVESHYFIAPSKCMPFRGVNTH